MAVIINQTLDFFKINYNIRSKEMEKLKKYILKNKKKKVLFNKRKKQKKKSKYNKRSFIIDEFHIYKLK